MKLTTPISPSQINRLACKRYFYWSYIAQDTVSPDEASTALKRGRLIHEVIEKYLRHLADTQQATDWDYMGQLVNTLNFGGGEEQYAIRDMLIQFAMGDIHDKDSLVEWPIAVKLDFGGYVNCEYADPEARIRGRFDRLTMRDGEDGMDVTVEDWKSSYYMPGAGALEHDPQARAYAFLVLASMPNITSVLVRFRYVRYGGAYREWVFTQDDRCKIADELEYWITQRNVCLEAHTAGKAIEEAWPAAACEHCEYCYSPCEVKSAMVLRPVFPKPVSQEEAGKLGAMLIVGEAAVKQLKDILKDWAKENGPIQAGKFTLGYSDETKTRFPALKVLKHYRELMAAGVDFTRLYISELADELKVRKRDGKIHKADTPQSAQAKEKLRSALGEKETTSTFGRL